MPKIIGLDSLQQDLRQMKKAKMNKTIRKWTEYVRGEAVDLCPVKTGELRQSIHSDVEDNGDTTVGTVYTDKEYAACVEFGTGRRGAASTGVSPDVELDYSTSINGQPAQPYMYPALNNNLFRVERGIREDMEKEIGRK